MRAPTQNGALLLFLIYVNELLPTINSQSKSVLFADDTNIIISYPNIECFLNCVNDIFVSLNKWIKPINSHSILTKQISQNSALTTKLV
jgi:hypothetical protein